MPGIAAAAVAPSSDGGGDAPGTSRELPLAESPTVHNRTLRWTFTDATGFVLENATVLGGAVRFPAGSNATDGNVTAVTDLGTDHPMPVLIQSQAAVGGNATIRLIVDLSTDNATWIAVRDDPAPGSAAFGGASARFLRWRGELRRDPNDTLPALEEVTLSYRVNRDPWAIAPGLTVGYRNTTVEVNGSGSRDPDGDPLTIVWQYLDGPAPVSIQNPLMPIARFVPTAVGLYRFTLVAADDTTGTNATRVNVSIVNRVPVVDAGPPQAVAKKTNAVLDGTASDDDGDVLQVQWTQLAGPTADLSDPRVLSPVFTAWAIGVFEFELRVSDGLTPVTDRTNVTVFSLPPVAVLTAAPNPAGEGRPVVFDASGSRDPEDGALRYRIAFGDGESTGWIDNATATHRYPLPGNYTATLAVLDTDGNSSVNAASVAIEVVAGPTPGENRPPVAGFRVVPDPPGTITTEFRFVSEAVDPDGDPVVSTWDFGDGSPPATGANVTHRYGSRGRFTAVQSVRDPDGLSATATASVEIGNSPPVLTLTLPPGNATVGRPGEPLTFLVAAQDPDGGVLTYRWEVDGVPAAGASGRTHTVTPSRDGTMVVTVTVSDSNASVEHRWTVRVRADAGAVDPGTLLLLAGAFTLAAAVALAGALWVRRRRTETARRSGGRRRRSHRGGGRGRRAASDSEDEE